MLVNYDKKKLKISSTAYRVLLLLRYLSKKEYSSNELNEFFLDDFYIADYLSKDVISKYVSTLRSYGYNITKPCPSNNYCYILKKQPVSIDIDDKNIKILAILYYYAKSLHQDKLLENYSLFFERVKSFLPENQIDLLNKELKFLQENPKIDFLKYSHQSKLIKKIEKYSEEKQRVSVLYKQPDDKERQIVLELKNIRYDINSVNVVGFNPANWEQVYLNIDYILEIKQLPAKNQYNKIFSPVKFRLKGGLAKGYRVYKDEKLVKDGEEEIIVTSYVGDKQVLLKRLLRYGENCEVLYPKRVRELMAKFINDSLSCYE